MAYLEQAASSVIDCDKFTYSAWVRVPAASEPAASAFLSLFRFGGIYASGFLQATSLIGINTLVGAGAGFKNGVYCLFQGPIISNPVAGFTVDAKQIWQTSSKYGGTPTGGGTINPYSMVKY